MEYSISPLGSIVDSVALAPMKLGYIMSRFPVITETFILNEMRAVEALGETVELFPLIRVYPDVIHPEAQPFAERAHYRWFVSFSILKSNVWYLISRPRRYLSVLWEVLRETFGSLNFFVGALGVFPKSVRFAEEMEAAGVDHIHAHFANHPTIAALIVHRLTDIPFSFTAHGHDIHVERRMLGHKITASTFAVSVSEYNRRLMLDECPEVDPHHVRVIHCGVDTEFFSPDAMKADSDALRILCVGYFKEVKGHPYLLDACGRLRRRGINYTCHLIGTGPDRDRLVAQANELDIAEHICWHDNLPQSSVRDLMQSVDVIVQPSVRTARGSREGIPVALMEGMATGCPAVASDISGIPELVRHGVTGLLVPPRDAVGLAKALTILAVDPTLRDRMGRASRQLVVEQFDLEKNAQRLLELIRETRGTTSAQPVVPTELITTQSP